MAVFIITFISLILDGILSNYLPYLVGDLSLLTPLFTVILVFLMYPIFYKNDKNYLIYTCILGIVYDLFYTNLLFFDAIIFTLLGLLTIYIYKIFNTNKLNIFLYLILFVILYESLLAIFILIFNLVPITFERLFYKIQHSLISNLIYGFIIYLIIDKVAQNKRKHKIYKFKG